MMDHTASALYEKLSSRRVDSTYLEVLGHKAASTWRSGASESLTDAVVGVVKQASLSNEEIKRVVEFANSAAFLDEFQKGASRYVSFSSGPADPSDVFQALQVSPTAVGGDLSDYHAPPAEKRGSDEALFAALQSSGSEDPLADPLREALDLRDKLASAVDHLTAELSESEVLFSMASDELYRQVKQACLSGVALSDVLRAWQTVGATEDYVKVAFQILTPRLLADGVYRDGSLRESLTKQASRETINTRHPLVTSFSDFKLSFNKMAQVRGTREEFENAFLEMDGFVKDAAAGKPVWNKVRDFAAEHAGEARDLTEKGVEKVLGEGGTKKHLPGLVEKAVKYAPHAAVGALGYHAYQRGTELAATPLGNTVASAIPYTEANRQAHQRRLMEAMQGRDDINYGMNYSM